MPTIIGSLVQLRVDYEAGPITSVMSRECGKKAVPRSLINCVFSRDLVTCKRCG